MKKLFAGGGDFACSGRLAELAAAAPASATLVGASPFPPPNIAMLQLEGMPKLAGRLGRAGRAGLDGASPTCYSPSHAYSAERKYIFPPAPHHARHHGVLPEQLQNVIKYQKLQIFSF